MNVLDRNKLALVCRLAFVGRACAGRVTMIALFCLCHVSLAVELKSLSLDRYAPAKEDLAKWAKNYDLLIKFSEAPEFIGRELSDQDEAVRNKLGQVCTMKTFVDCQTYLLANRQSVLSAMPNNPLYWESFWHVLKAANLLDFSRPLVEQGAGQQRLLSATYWWFYKDLADDGRVEIERALSLQEALRNWRTGYQTLISRMIALAMQGIAYDQMSFAMAQASRDRDSQQLNRLARALRPFDVEDMSWGPILWIEREWSLKFQEKSLTASPPNEVDVQTALMQAEGEIEESELRIMLEDPTEFLRRDSDRLAGHYVPISTMSWDDYWSKGIPPIDEVDFGKFSLAAVGASAYADYISTERATHFQAFLFPALADIYSGRVSPGLPARPAPRHWRWEWREGKQPELCLVGENIHASTRHMPRESADSWCVDFYDEAAVERLYPD